MTLAAFVVYWLTLYPGMGGGGDSVKFQYIGRVLGTAHPPGYPLYVLISHVFSWLPVEPLAYRINLMSACFGALTAGFVYLTAREAGGSRLAGLTAGLGLAFGRAFWSKAVVAEVYTLGACLLAAVVWLTLRWRHTRRDRDLLLAVGVAALAIGNHLTIAFVVPALVAYVLLVDWRQAIRVLSASGQLVTATAVDTTRTLRVPLDMSLLPLYRVVSASQCAAIGNLGWVDVTEAASATRLVARIDNYRPFDSTFVFYAATTDSFDLTLVATGGHGQPAVDVRAFDAPSAPALSEALKGDGLENAGTLLAAGKVWRVAIAVNDAGQFSTATFRLTAPPTRAFARATVDLDNARRATLCGDQRARDQRPGAGLTVTAILRNGRIRAPTAFRSASWGCPPAGSSRRRAAA